MRKQTDRLTDELKKLKNWFSQCCQVNEFEIFNSTGMLWKSHWESQKTNTDQQLHLSRRLSKVSFSLSTTLRAHQEYVNTGSGKANTLVGVVVSAAGSIILCPPQTFTFSGGHQAIKVDKIVDCLYCFFLCSSQLASWWCCSLRLLNIYMLLFHHAPRIKLYLWEANSRKSTKSNSNSLRLIGKQTSVLLVIWRCCECVCIGLHRRRRRRSIRRPVQAN